MCIRDSHPDVNVCLRFSNTDRLLEAIRAGEMDLALSEGYIRSEEFDTELFRRERYIPVCAAGHALPAGKQKLKDLLGERPVSYTHLDVYKRQDMIQAVLGGIGAVSLFVAAIGIANTMMMSIYERTREIGVLKVLGCALGDIQMCIRDRPSCASRHSTGSGRLPFLYQPDRRYGEAPAPRM